MSKEDDLVKLLKEARKIIRSSLSRGLYKDWDQRATAALAGPKPFKGTIDDPKDFSVVMEPVGHSTGFAPFKYGVRVTHVPSGITYLASSERSQHANRQRALEYVKEELGKL